MITELEIDKSQRLINLVQEKKSFFKIDNGQSSPCEIASLNENDELIIRPAYQRLFRWSHSQRVKLIESILLGIPLPPIFVFQESDGKWELVDGLQRVSTMLQFMGKLNETNSNKTEDHKELILSGTKYLPDLEGFSWSGNEQGENILPDALKLAFRRARLNLVIIDSISDKNSKFEVFQRLNTGGTNASNQEVRNSVMLMKNEAFYVWFETLSKKEFFLNTLSITERLEEEQYPMELLLKFLALILYKYDSKLDLNEYLDMSLDKMLDSESFPYSDLEIKFDKTFTLLNEILQDKAFKKYYSNGEFKGKFMDPSFEALSIGISENIIENNNHDLILERIKEMYSDDSYLSITKQGTTAKNRIPKLIPFATEFFKLVAQ